MEEKDMKIPFGDMIKCMSERNMEGLEKICDKYKAARCSLKPHSENIGKCDLISIGYSRALMDVMQAFMEQMRSKSLKPE